MAAEHNTVANHHTQTEASKSLAVVISFKETTGLSRQQEPFTTGVPFAAGHCPANTLLSLWDDKLQLPVNAEPMLYWPDGSIRWLLINSRVDIAANSEKQLQLCLNAAAARSEQIPVICKKNAEYLVVETAKRIYQFSQNVISIRSSDTPDLPLELQLKLKDRLNNITALDFEDWQILSTDNIKTRVQTKGIGLLTAENAIAHIKLTVTLYHADGLMQLKTTLHNPRRAKHQGGLWDLGDSGSLHFNRFSLAVTAPNLKQSNIIPDCLAEPDARFKQQSFCLHQDSSGGENWHSANHVNKDGIITTSFQGYQLLAENALLKKGRRAHPLLSSWHGEQPLQISVPEFWQNFPNALQASLTQLRCDLFAELANGLSHELQGGERKTRILWLSFNEQSDALAWSYTPLVPQLEAAYLAQSHAMPWLNYEQDDPLAALIQLGLNGENNFYRKREKIDEYGWRNFGDIFADHETLYQNAEAPRYISHYNNQYDAVYGFSRQFLISGDSRWFRLMDELARHVTDIDIYHTTEDRHEYNNGLFWHTDHYVDAYTATHRTYSHKNDPTGSGQIGGGPGPEHCYSTGLLYHYLFTGNEESKAAVLELAEWMVFSHEGAGGLLEQLFFIKDLELPKLKALLRGDILACNRYPFTRGTANYINVLLDAHKLEPKKGWLARAEQVIKATFHPADHIAAHNLLDAETGWHYLVLLSSLVNFLQVKAEYQQFDTAYRYIQQCFIHYSRWMLQNEKPFLDNADQLEYPNHTWVAQDLRKAMLLFIAKTLDPVNTDAYQTKATFFLNYVVNTLTHSAEQQLARLQVIMLLVHGPHLCHSFGAKLFDNEDLSQLPQKPIVLNKSTLLRHISKRLLKGLCSFNPTKEHAWLKLRLKVKE